MCGILFSLCVIVVYLFALFVNVQCFSVVGGVFNSILKKAIREAKISYYNMMFEKYKYDIKNTWKTISEVLSKAKRKQKTL